MRNLPDLCPPQSYDLLVAFMKEHAKDIWNHWVTNLYLDKTLPPGLKRTTEVLFRRFLDVFYYSCDFLVQNQIIHFYNMMMEQWLLPNQYQITTYVANKGLILLEKAILPLLPKHDLESSTTIINQFQDLFLQLIYIIYEMKNRSIEINFTEYLDALILLLERLPVERVLLTRIEESSLIPIEVWEGEKGFLSRKYSKNIEKYDFINKDILDDRVYYVSIDDKFVLVIEGNEPFTKEHFLYLNRINHIISDMYDKNKKILNMKQQIVKLELMNYLDEKLVSHSGFEGLIDVFNDCQEVFGFSRSAFFGYSPWSQTGEGIFGINIDQQKIQSIREPVNKIRPFKDAMLTKKPLHLIDSRGDGKIPERYLDWFGVTSLFIVPIVNDNNVLGWLLLDKNGEKFEVKNPVYEIAEMIGARVGKYLARNEEITSLFKEVKLTDREIDILYLLAEGYDNKKIAKKLYISEYTVRDHISNLMVKFKAKNRTQVVASAFRYRILK